MEVGIGGICRPASRLSRSRIKTKYLVDSTKSADCVKLPRCLLNERWVEFGRPDDTPKHASPEKLP